MFNSDQRTKKKSPLKVSFKSDKIKNMSDYRTASKEDAMQNEVDRILEKIKKEGYDNLTDAEKETLYQASKK